MSRPLIDKKEVALAIEALKKDGKSPTAPAVRAACGGKGSYSTILQLMTELADEESAASDSPQALEAFRAIWRSAIQEGRGQRDEEIRNSQETLSAMSAEINSLEGEAVSGRTAAEEATRKCEDVLFKQSKLTEELALARATSERNANKLVEILQQHSLIEKQLREEVTQWQCENHKLQVKLTRVETKLAEAVKAKARNKASKTLVEV